MAAAKVELNQDNVSCSQIPPFHSSWLNFWQRPTPKLKFIELNNWLWMNIRRHYYIINYSNVNNLFIATKSSSVYSCCCLFVFSFQHFLSICKSTNVKRILHFFLFYFWKSAIFLSSLNLISWLGRLRGLKPFLCGIHLGDDLDQPQPPSGYLIRSSGCGFKPPPNSKNMQNYSKSSSRENKKQC